MTYLLILWINAAPVMQKFNTLEQCEQIKSHAIKYDNHVEYFENGKPFLVKNMQNAECIKLTEGK